MRTDFAFVAVMMLAAVLLMGVALIGAAILRPKKPSKAKLETYECGMETVGDAWVQFRVQYYIFALIFVLFDVGGVFLFPFAVAYNSLPLYTIVIVSLFILTLLGSLLYAWRKGVLQWD
ncbi:MAG TPA: NADH-quinone oxidoreductase subunit A [Anaerolineae bacterium]|jgi:NADH-quinone oxidoreductase subunit A